MGRLFREKMWFRRLRPLLFTKAVIQSKGRIDSMIQLRDLGVDREVVPLIDTNIEELKADTIRAEVVTEVEVGNKNVLRIELLIDIETEVEVVIESEDGPEVGVVTEGGVGVE